MQKKLTFDNIILMIVPICVLVILLIIALAANIKAYQNEKEQTTEYFSMLAVTCSARAENEVQDMYSEAEYAGQLISTSRLQLSTMTADFETVFESSDAEQGLVAAETTLVYGSNDMFDVFSSVAAKAESKGASTISDIEMCSDGVYRFAVATPVTMSYGGHVTVILVYPLSALDDITAFSTMVNSGNVYIINSDGMFLTGTGDDWSDLEGSCSASLMADSTRGLTEFKEYYSGEKYLAFSRSLGVNGWYSYFAVPLSTVNEHTSQSIGVFFKIVIIALIVLIASFLYYYFGMSASHRREIIDRKKFAIVVRQSSRAVFEYDTVKDRFYFINDCESIKLPGKADYLSRAMGLSYVYPQDRHKLEEAVEVLKTSPTASSTIRASYFNGSNIYRWYYFTVTHLARRGPGNTVYLGIIEDIDEREKERIALLTKATTDSLTGLYNREETERLINERLGKRTEGEVSAFIIFDLDDFKSINDTYGHDAGDKCLRFFADKLKATFRVEDVVGRIGGDEFVVYMTYITEDDFVLQRFSSFAECIAMRRNADDDLPYISCSAGYVTVHEGDDFEALYKRADKALYRAKTIGKNCVVSGD